MTIILIVLDIAVFWFARLAFQRETYCALAMNNDDRCSFLRKRRSQVASWSLVRKSRAASVHLRRVVALLADPGESFVSPRDPTATWPSPERGRD